jgi:hypothetical protein
MNVRTLSIISLAILSFSSISPAQQEATNQPAVAPAAPDQASTPPRVIGGRRGGGRGDLVARPSPQDETVNRVVVLRYAQANALARILASVSPNVGIVPDDRTNQLILLAGSSERIEQVIQLVQSLDVPHRPASPVSRSLMCRVYMVEVPPEGSELRPFCMSLLLSGGPMTMSAQAMMTAVKDLRIKAIEFNSTGDVVTIVGQAASNTTILDMVTKIPESILKTLTWDPNGRDSVALAPAPTQAPPLTGQVAENVQSLLAGRMQTVGYWFGHISVPGTISVPIGSWRLIWNAALDQENETRVSISVDGEPIPGRSNRILENVIRSDLGKSIIIGYNRESGGARTTGALVILLEPDTALKPKQKPLEGEFRSPSHSSSKENRRTSPSPIGVPVRACTSDGIGIVLARRLLPAQRSLLG